MKKILLLHFFVFQLSALHSQHHDPKVAEVKAGFAEYAQTNDIQKLYSIGYELPPGIYISTVTTAEEKFNITRYERTELYIMWVEAMINSGYDINFDPNDPKNTAYRNSVIGSVDKNGVMNEWAKRNHENQKKQTKHHTFKRIMTNFDCFYKFGFKKHLKSRTHLVEIIESYCAKKGKNPDVLIALFKRELKKQKCSY